MKQAFENIVPLVAPNGKLLISIYNDQGQMSHIWHWIKRTYNASGPVGQFILALLALLRCWTKPCVEDLLLYGNPLKRWRGYIKNRGMSPYRDVIDWVGGYPFEVAKPESVFDFFRLNGFDLKHLKTCAGGLGCNEFVFQKR
jgi:2-polyprenyl-6-hydroxyphenyl methylase/3-demethylubiquinone-9 3-methyltransferase